MSVLIVLENRKKELARRQSENGLLKKTIVSNDVKIHEYLDKVRICREALSFLQDVADTRRNSLKTKIESVLSEALRVIYGLNYRVQLVYSVKNNRSNMEIEVVKNTPAGEVPRTMDGFGGGVSDSIAVPLRLLVMLGSRQTDKVAILDEAYKHVDPDRIETVANFIKDISNKLGVQIILLSHHDIMQNVADKVFQISDNNGKSVLKTS